MKSMFNIYDILCDCRFSTYTQDTLRCGMQNFDHFVIQYAIRYVGGPCRSEELWFRNIINGFATRSIHVPPWETTSTKIKDIAILENDIETILDFM